MSTNGKQKPLAELREEMTPRRSRLIIRPVTLREANTFVRAHHRHHGPSRGCKWALAVVDESGQVRGVAICGRPVSRMLDDGLTVEVLRVATDGCQNACSCLYGACWRVAMAMGYRLAITYTLASEPGTSLRAAGWIAVAEVDGRSWSCPSRPRVDKHPTEDKVRWQRRAPSSPLATLGG